MRAVPSENTLAWISESAMGVAGSGSRRATSRSAFDVMGEHAECPAGAVRLVRIGRDILGREQSQQRHCDNYVLIGVGYRALQATMGQATRGPHRGLCLLAKARAT